MGNVVFHVIHINYSPILDPSNFGGYFTTGQILFRWVVKSFYTVKARGPAAQAGGIFVKQVLSDGKKRKSVDRPWGILSLFTTWIDSPCQRLWHKNACGVSLWRSFFLRWITADPSLWGNFTPPRKQQCGETLGELEPVYDYEWIHPASLWHRQAASL